jgi:hypothetical protein
MRQLGAEHEFTFKSHRPDVVPGHLVTLSPTRRWTHQRSAHVSGEITEVRIDIPALRLEPHKLRHYGPMDPSDGEPYDRNLKAL